MLSILGLWLLVAIGDCHPQRQPRRRDWRHDDLLPHPYDQGHCDPVTIQTTVTVAATETETLTEYIYVPTNWPASGQGAPSPFGDPSGWGSGGQPGASSPQGPGGAGSWSGAPPTSGQASGAGDNNAPASPQGYSSPPNEPSDDDSSASSPWGPPSPPQPPSWPSGKTGPPRPWPTYTGYQNTSMSTSRSSTTWMSTTSATSSSSSLTTTSQTSSSTSPAPTPDDWPGHTVTGYYGSGNVDIFPPENIPWQYLTHLCYAFAGTQGSSADYAVTYNRDLLRYLSDEAHAHSVKLILSIGGFGLGGRYFSDIVQNNVTIGAFVVAVQNIVSEFDLAGVDIDWEFVGKLDGAKDHPYTDADGYLNMLQALRAAMPSAELSAAVPMHVFWKSVSPTDGTLVTVDMLPYEPYLDRVYLMTYDLWNLDDESPVTSGSNGALTPNPPSTPTNPEQEFGAEGVRIWNQAGFPMDKLVYGVPFYGYGYWLAENADPAKTGLYTPSEGRSSGDSNENPVDNTGFWKWRNLKSQQVVVAQGDGSYGAGPGWTYGWDDSTQTPYIYSDAGVSDPQIISYDDPHSIGIKRQFAKDHGMEGMMFWAMYGDTDDGELTKLLA